MIKCRNFCVAYRYKKHTPLFENLDLSDFKIIKSPICKWCADPFPLFYKGKNYIFAEIASVYSRKGKIGYICLDDKKPKWHICLSEKFHLSYPNIFISNGKIFMIPETKDNHSITQYVCTSFPFKWTFFHTLEENVSCVDTSFFKSLFLTYDMGSKPYRLLVKENNLTKLCINDEYEKFRPAGNPVLYKNQIIVPTQFNTNFYGEKIIFNYFRNNSFIEFSVLDSKILLKHFKNKKICGCHTYNFNGVVEVIDIVLLEFSLLRLIKKIISKAKHIFKRR